MSRRVNIKWKIRRTRKRKGIVDEHIQGLCITKILSIRWFIRMHFLTSILTLSDDLVIYSSGTIPILSKELNLKQTLLGGQAFRYSEFLFLHLL